MLQQGCDNLPLSDRVICKELGWNKQKNNIVYLVSMLLRFVNTKRITMTTNKWMGGGGRSKVVICCRGDGLRTQ